MLNGDSSQNCYTDGGIEHNAKWKESLSARTISRRNSNLMQLVYGPTSESAVAEEEQNNSESEASDDENFFKPKGEREKVTPLLVRQLATLSFHEVPNFNYLCLFLLLLFKILFF